MSAVAVERRLGIRTDDRTECFNTQYRFRKHLKIKINNPVVNYWKASFEKRNWFYCVGE